MTNLAVNYPNNKNMLRNKVSIKLSDYTQTHKNMRLVTSFVLSKEVQTR